MSCALHTTYNGLGYSMNSSGNYSTFAPPCSCSPAWQAATAAARAAGIVLYSDESSSLPVRRTDTSADEMPEMLPQRSMTYGIGSGTGAGAGLAAAGGGIGLPSPHTVPSLLATRTNGGGIQPGDLDGLSSPSPAAAPALTRSMTGAYDYDAEVGFSNRTPMLFRESRFSAHSTSTEGDGDGAASSAPLAPPARRTGTEHHGVSWAEPAEANVERIKEESRASLRQLLYALQQEMEQPRRSLRWTAITGIPEPTEQRQRYNELDEQIEATLRLLTLLN